MVARNRVYERHVEIRHNGNLDGYFVNTFFPLIVVGHDVAFCLQDLESFVRVPAPALASDLVLDLFSQSQGDVPSVAANADNLDCTAYLQRVYHNYSSLVEEQHNLP